MCGICGFTNFNKDKNDKKVLSDMIESIKHRGPDNQSFYSDEIINLGHTRLSILDINNGNQPFYSEDKKIIVIFNGEIYNYQELKDELIKLGHSFNTTCDTEIIPKLFQQFGKDFVNKLRGMFAIAIYDKENKELFLIRDRLGIKPLYYSLIKNNIVFSSEIKSIFKHPDISPEFNLEFMNFYMKLGLVPTPYTIYDGVLKVKPGTYLKIKNNDINEITYWKFPINKRIKASEENKIKLRRKLRKKIEECVKIRLNSDIKPIGVYLSGGIDSSTVASLAQKNSNSIIETFNFTFQNNRNKERDESAYATLVAKEIGSNYNQLYYNENSFDLIEKTLYHLEEPTINIFNAQTFYQMASEVSNRNLKVILMGEGSDEILGGYYFHLMEKIKNEINVSKHYDKCSYYRKLPGREYLSDKACYQYYSLHNDITSFIEEDLGCYLPYLTEPYVQRNYILSTHMQHLLKDYTDIDINRIIEKPNTNNIFDKDLYYDVNTRLIDYIIPTREKINMAFGIECRFPFLDHEFVEFASTIPEEFLLENYKNKAILKDAVADILPESIIKRSKHGLSVTNELDLTKHECLTEDYIEKTGYFNYDVLSNVLEEYKLNKKPYLEFSLGTIIERVLTIQLLHKLFIDKGVR